ncbi:MAG: hypothetical protein VKP62_03135 [Candidatus Sericytochromatia bacterium]|nr:hypothetical protein [Candidatus Sericytochromatia bacterium]
MNLPFNLPNLPQMPELPQLVDYRLGEQSLQIVALNGMLVLREIPYGSMRQVKRGYELWSELHANHVDLLGKAVSIELDRALLPWLVVTPADPAAFMLELSRRIAGAKKA